MSLFDLVSLSSSIASLILAIVAIWLALYHKKETDSVNSDTRNLLMEVKTDAKALSTVAMPELKAYGDSMRKLVFEIKKPTENQTDKKSYSEIEDQLEEIKSSSDDSELIEKLNSIEEILIKQKNNQLSHPEISDEYISVDLSVIGAGVMSSPIEQFHTVQEFLDLLWLNFLNKEVPAYTYGSKWVITDKYTKDPISTIGKSDNRTLIEAGIMGGVEYVVEIL